MFPEIEHFSKWLHCQSPHATTHVHYTSDVRLFFAWADKPSSAITRPQLIVLRPQEQELTVSLPPLPGENAPPVQG